MHSHWCRNCESWWDCDDGDDCWEGENAPCGCDEYYENDEDY